MGKMKSFESLLVVMGQDLSYLGKRINKLAVRRLPSKRPLYPVTAAAHPSNIAGLHCHQTPQEDFLPGLVRVRDYSVYPVDALEAGSPVANTCTN